MYRRKLAEKDVPSSGLQVNVRLTKRQYKRDLILMGNLKPEACCPYGVCKGMVVISMG
jgi:hypothetical protein